jgi:hypothetical protein
MSNLRNRGMPSRKLANQAEQQNLRAHSTAKTEGYEVSSTWTNTVRVTDREVGVIDLYLGDAIDRLLGLERRPKARGPPQ